MSTLRPGAWVRLGARTAGVISALFLVLGARVLVASRSELAEGDLVASRDPTTAITHYRRAARWYAPQNPYSNHALTRLAELGLAAEHRGEEDLALSAWRSVRGAILATRSFYTPHREALATADEHIAVLMAHGTPPAMDATRTEEERRLLHLALLRRPSGPRIGFGLLALVAFAVWIFASFAFASRAIDVDDRFVQRPARAWGSLWILAFGVFLLGLSQA